MRLVFGKPNMCLLVTAEGSRAHSIPPKAEPVSDSMAWLSKSLGSLDTRISPWDPRTERRRWGARLSPSLGSLPSRPCYSQETPPAPVPLLPGLQAPSVRRHFVSQVAASWLCEPLHPIGPPAVLRALPQRSDPQDSLLKTRSGSEKVQKCFFSSSTFRLWQGGRKSGPNPMPLLAPAPASITLGQQ